ncbi:hypothetical protein DNTS_030257 [Danionella cerebrum]|uniref:Uncharacterized protein n=1 Tax=Danionella cerebrum TaxID=2873325 RepID=A0A553R9N5_9TELE|nr:hypothetical protein DNTS_030257 [Danionella translucida]
MCILCLFVLLVCFFYSFFFFLQQNMLLVTEQITKTVVIKLQRSTVLKSGRQKSQNVQEAEIICLSDLDTSQSDRVHELEDHASEKSSTFVKGIEAEPVQKVSLGPGAMAEDTLGNLRFITNVSESSLESQEDLMLDGSSADLTATSGPSSPHNPAYDDVRCTKCERLFAKISSKVIKSQESPKKKSRDKDPSSLSCVEWVLLKKWHPQRAHCRERGLLWTSLSRIRENSVQGFGFSDVCRNNTNCSRPHVFQRRNLHHCKYLKTMAKSKKHRKRKQHWPPVPGWNPLYKKKGLRKNTTQQLYLCVTKKQKLEVLAEEPGALVKEDLLRIPEDSSKTRICAQSTKKKEVSEGLDGTRRVLRFDQTTQTLAMEQTTIPQKSGDAANDSQEELPMDLNYFRTPQSLHNVKPNIKQRERKVSAEGETGTTNQKFGSFLAIIVKGQNRIIKESCK